MSGAPSIAPVTRTLSQRQVQAYADAAGDHNPLHIDPEFARATPFGGTIAHGMLVLAMIEEMMYAALGGRWASSGRLKVRFKAPARPGDTVTASAHPSGEGVYAVRCASESGETLIEGRATVGGAA
ncbi:MAG: MaoC family dehydratase [Dehalococcoidia bacterium]